MLLFVDTETTGFVHMKLDPSDPKQPHIVQLACMLVSEEGRIIKVFDSIIKPEGYEIPTEASDVHGITTEKALKEGQPASVVLSHYLSMHNTAHVQVAHNADFDRLALKSFLHRQNNVTLVKAMRCTMLMCRDILKIPPTTRMRQAGFLQYKNPTLGECYKFFFHRELQGAHNALNDVRATTEVYFAAQKRLGGNKNSA